jgi:hypothetical protein
VHENINTIVISNYYDSISVKWHYKKDHMVFLNVFKQFMLS